MTGQTPPGLARVGTAALSIEALVVLLAIPAVVSLRGDVPLAAVVYLLGVVLILIVAAGLQRRPGGRLLGTLAQVPVVAAGAVTWPLYVLGVLFAGLWLAYLRLGRGAPAR